MDILICKGVRKGYETQTKTSPRKIWTNTK